GGGTPAGPRVPQAAAGSASITRGIELPARASQLRVRFEGGIGVRLAPGSDGGASTRGTFGGMVRPWSEFGFGFGLRGDVGSAWPVTSGGFAGHWRDGSVVAAASWTFERGMFDIEPWIGAGVPPGTLTGDQRGTWPRDDLNGPDL